jgi:hypothetical protein
MVVKLQMMQKIKNGQFFSIPEITGKPVVSGAL